MRLPAAAVALALVTLAGCGILAHDDGPSAEQRVAAAAIAERQLALEVDYLTARGEEEERRQRAWAIRERALQSEAEERLAWQLADATDAALDVYNAALDKRNAARGNARREATTEALANLYAWSDAFVDIVRHLSAVQAWEPSADWGDWIRIVHADIDRVRLAWNLPPLDLR